MLYTLTLNPSIDYAMEIGDIEIGATNYTKTEYMLPGGKGINVSRVLSHLEVPNKALGFIGGHTGKFIEDWLMEEQAAVDFVPVAGDTRINVKLKGEHETEINGLGPVISEGEMGELLEKIEQLTEEDTLIISGSKNRGIPEDFYLQIIEKLSKNGASFVIDTNSKELLEALAYKPILVKPNQAELGDLFEVTIETEEDVIEYGQKLHEKGAQNVIISLGGDGAVFIDDEVIYKADSPKGEVVNTVGSGDSMIAGFMAGITKGLSKKEAFELGVQSGSATAFNQDLAKKEDVYALNNQVKMRKVEKK